MNTPICLKQLIILLYYDVLAVTLKRKAMSFYFFIYNKIYNYVNATFLNSYITMEFYFLKINLTFILVGRIKKNSSIKSSTRLPSSGYNKILFSNLKSYFQKRKTISYLLKVALKLIGTRCFNYLNKIDLYYTHLQLKVV